jgi:hypothetical protein
MAEHTLGDGPIEEAYRERMNWLAHAIDEFFNGDLRGEQRQIGFCLMVFKFGDGGRANYISNANRDDVVIMLKEQLKRFEGQPENEGPRMNDTRERSMTFADGLLTGMVLGAIIGFAFGAAGLLLK